MWTSSVAQYCMLSHFQFGHRGDLIAFVICVKAGLIWHGLQSSEEIVRGPVSQRICSCHSEFVPVREFVPLEFIR